MKSITKNRLGAQRVQQVCRRHFPGAGALTVRELTGGMFNAAYLLKGEGLPPQGVVLKVGPGPDAVTLTYERDILKAEVEVYGLLQGKGLPLPKLYAWDFSREILPADYFLMECLPGATWKDRARRIPAGDRPALMRQLGRCNAAVHSVKGPWFGYLKQERRFHFDTWGGAFTAMVEDILADGRAHGCRLPEAEVRAALAGRRALLDEVQEPRLVDFDLWAGNVFVAPQNGHYAVTGILDFERAFYGDPCADFVSAVMLFDDVEAEPEFLAGYRAAGGRALPLTEHDRRRMELYRLYTALIMCVEAYRYGPLPAALLRAHQQKQIQAQLKRLAATGEK